MDQMSTIKDDWDCPSSVLSDVCNSVQDAKLFILSSTLTTNIENT